MADVVKSERRGKCMERNNEEVVVLLNPQQLMEGQHLTFPRYRSILQQWHMLNGISLGIYEENQLVALLLAVPFKNYPYKVQIISIYVSKTHRLRGLGRQLMKEAEREVRRRGYQGLEIQYLDQRQDHQALETILESEGWAKPQVITRMYKRSIEGLKERWRYPKQGKVPRATSDIGFYLKPLHDLKNDQKHQILEGQGQWYPSQLNPFLHQGTPNRETSFVAMMNDSVIGWISTIETTQGNEKGIGYLTYFMRKEYRETLLGARLLIRSLQAHYELRDQRPQIIFEVAEINKAMLHIIGSRFTEDKLKPCYHKHLSYKKL